jgi:hypothetical protein
LLFLIAKRQFSGVVLFFEFVLAMLSYTRLVSEVFFGSFVVFVIAFFGLLDVTLRSTCGLVGAFHVFRDGCGDHILQA